VHGTAISCLDDRRATTAPGTGFLRIARHGRRSVVSRAFASSPLKLLTPRNHGCGAWIYTSTYGGGLVDRDALRLHAQIDEGASAFLSTQAATKVYRSPNGTSADFHATVGGGGVLVSLPDPVICFASSTYRQTQRFDLAESASLVLLDWMSSGRRESGERWTFDRYSTRITVRCEDRLVVYDALSLDSLDGDLADRMGRFDVFAIVVLTGPALRDHAERAVARVASMPVPSRSDLLISASPLAGGAIIRAAGVSIEAVGRALRAHLTFVPALLGDDPSARKW